MPFVIFRLYEQSKSGESLILRLPVHKEVPDEQVRVLDRRTGKAAYRG